ncbi:protein cordon-bleu isoform X2 [Myripristis murdjan]|uniref:protein cordon-bleu isoform X2 n=1 Tax=Myripristis murdjan TaxID=586833 RepID=UPI001175FA09|nr:protein cordon-bleu isoform X2 [Myripristis murdjan]
MESSRPPVGKRMKARAPPPPQVPEPAPRHIFRNAVPDGGGTGGMDAKENVLRPTVDIHLTLPQGFQTTVTEDGSKALMDLLVELCSCYHLNPALHTLELLSPEGHPLGFKPNALLGSLNVACVLIKEKVWEEKVVRRPAPKVPEKTVRLVVNYHRNQKAVVRVNPLVPLQTLLPVICDKCEFDPAHVLLLKDSISRHELPLDKSLTQLEIKELYVLDQSLVLQPKMASAPALNYSGSICSSTTSVRGAEKKGLLGIFKFSRRKSKTEETSMDMDDTDDKVVQNTDTHSSGLSSVSMVPCVEARPSTLGQSQSVMNISRMSPKTETKKRRAPAPPGAPTPTFGHYSFEGCQVGLGSESQQRKRKAPAPPPTPASITPGPDDTSASATPTPNSHTEAPIPASRSKLVQPTAVSTATVVTQTSRASQKTVVQVTPVSTDTPIPDSPTPSSTTIDSLPIQDSSSELSHSIDDSDVDPAGFTSSSSTVGMATPARAQLTATSSAPSSRMEESEQVSSADQSDQEATAAGSSGSETESSVNLKLDEVENNRHSAIGIADRPAPPKPRRSPAREPPQLVLPPSQSTPPMSSPPLEPSGTNSPRSSMEVEAAAPQSWLHSLQRSVADGNTPEPDVPEEETLSVGSSSGGSSLPDQGYAASEGMAEGEDSGLVSSPSDTQPTSPDGSLSLDGSSGGGGERVPGPVRDNSSDSDEGCATWGSRHRHNGISSKEKSGRLKDNYEDDPELTAQLHQTLADFEADLAEISHMDIVSVKETLYTLSTDSNDVPVSVVDMDVPVTAIDEILEDYGDNTSHSEAKPLTRTQSGASKGPSICHQANGEVQNKNNNACTAGGSSESSSANTQQPSQSVQHRKSLESMNERVKDQRQTNTLKEEKQMASALKSNVDVQKKRENTQLKPGLMKSNTLNYQEKKHSLSPNDQRSAPTKEEEIPVYRIHQNDTSTTTSHSKITHNSTSRFGMKTFTVVPPKPSVTHAVTVKPAVTVTTGAIKIDEQGNMVKLGMSRNKFGGSSESNINCKDGSPLLGKAKAFWSSNERQESALAHSRDPTERTKENTDGLKHTYTTMSEATVKTNKTGNLKMTETTSYEPAEKSKSEVIVKEKAKETVKEVPEVTKEERVDVESKVSVSKRIQQPSDKPPLPPTLLQDQKRDLSFLKPSRRTSSQYVASAISKSTPKTLACPSSIPNIPESSSSLKTQNFTFQKEGRSIHVNPHQFSHSSLSNDKEISSGSLSHPPGPKRSMSYPEYMPDRHRDPEELKQDRGEIVSCLRSTNGSFRTLEAETANTKLIRPSSPSQINVTTSEGQDNIKYIQARSPSPTQISPLHTPPPLSPTTQATAFKTASRAQTNREKSSTGPLPALAKKPEPSVIVSDDTVLPEPQQVTVFGPVKKFRPVICKSVQKDTCLHSSLMEAIQTGGGKDRLRKISGCGPSSLKKPSYVEEENERSSLLAAIRDRSNSGRLRKTKSEAADELEKFRKAAAEENDAGPPTSPSTPSLSCLSSSLMSPASTQPSSPPPTAQNGPPPPPPPPVPPQVKPSVVLHTVGNTHMDPAVAREAMLAAIRSGSAAEKLKKIAAPIKTVQVNGRLGTIQATSSTLPQK